MKSCCRAFWLTAVAVVVFLIASLQIFLATPEEREAAMFKDSYTHPRTLARILSQEINVSESLSMTIISAVPVFGDEAYIALISERPRDVLWRHWLPERTEEFRSSMRHLFCSGPGGSHRYRLECKGSVLLCPWPPEERHQIFFHVYLEDADGTVLGSIVASHQPHLLGQYQIMACVPDLFDADPEHPENTVHSSGAFSLLVQWMEWYWMNGVEHFLVYSFDGYSIFKKDMAVLNPYFDAGVASMIDFDSFPSNALSRKGHLMNDCLFRAKNHAQWLIAGFDLDDFLYVPQKLAPALKDRSILSDPTRFHTLAFTKLRFTKAKTNQVILSSGQYEPCKNQTGCLRPKQVVNVDYAYRLSIYQAELFDEGKLEHLMPRSATVRSYSLPFNCTELRKARNATDDRLLTHVASLTEALRRRFKLQGAEDVPIFLNLLANSEVQAMGPILPITGELVIVKAC
eukprot:Skav209972  [mRNA]  locus=scaffold3013:67533:69618:- [translate_table: standard]